MLPPMEVRMNLVCAMAFIFLFFSNISVQASVNQNASCVLVFEKNINVYSGLANLIYSSSQRNRVVTEATPLDILNCINDGFDEVVIIGHATEMPNGNVFLVYKEFSAASEGYVDKPIYPSVFHRIRRLLEDQDRDGKRHLTRIRWASCLREQIFKTYPDLINTLKDFAIELDVAPRNEKLSEQLGVDVTTITDEWLCKGEFDPETIAACAKVAYEVKTNRLKLAVEVE